MSEKITWSLNVQINGGPKLSASQALTVDAYDKIAVSIDDGVSDKEVQVQPGGSGQVQFLMIQADSYSDQVSYKVNSASATDTIALDALQVYMGKGAIGCLDPAPETLFFSNSSGATVSLGILVGRKATV